MPSHSKTPCGAPDDRLPAAPFAFPASLYPPLRVPDRVRTSRFVARRCGPILLAILLLTLPLLPPPVEGQEMRGWNSERVLDLVERARFTRAELRGEEGLESYSAHAEGHIYFFVDPAEGDRALIRVDQVALETYWMAPNHSKQVVVGLREETRLPVRDFHYFVDRLTVIQNNFGDVIRIGEGSDVAGAPHPFAVRRSVGTVALNSGDPRGEAYDFRLADSLTVSLPGEQEPVRLYRVEVRPRDHDAPGIVGSIHLDRATASIVRMDFTFTPASYTDPRNDWIRVSMDHGLWEGRHWLPHQQRIEVRREIPEFDIGAGTVIRAVMRVSGYELNVPLDEDFFAGRAIVARPEAVREQYPFREGLLERVGEEGLRDADRHLDPRQIRAEAAALMRSRTATGMPPLRFHVPALSSFVRYNRAEGLFLGAGGVYSPDAPVQLQGGMGYAFGPERLALRGEARTDLRPTLSGRIAGYGNRLTDIGPSAGSSGLLNTFAALATGRDYLDPYFIHGGEIGLDRRAGPWQQSLTLALQEHRSADWMRATAPFDDNRDFRSLRPIEEGTRVSARLRLQRAGDPLLLRSHRVAIGLEGGTFEGSGFSRTLLSVGTTLRSSGFERSLEADIHAGVNVGETPPQHLFLLGGRQTLPGFPYRGFGGEHFARLSADAAQDLFGGQWLRLHALGWAAWSHLPDDLARPGWNVAETDGVRASLGAGLGIFYDIVRLDLARGLGGGEWQLLLSIDPLWWDRL